MQRMWAIALLLLCAGSVRAETVRFASVAVGSVAAGPEITGWLTKPSGPGPFPAVILAHSCGGQGPHTDAWSARLVKWGYVVLAPDSFTPRGTKAVCTTPNVVTPNMRVADIAGALDFPRDAAGSTKGRRRPDRPQPWRLDHDALAAEDVRPQGTRPEERRCLLPGLQSGVQCRGRPAAADLDRREGRLDASRPCRRLQPQRPELVESVYYPNAYHAFDARAPDRNVPGVAGKMHHLAYDPVAAPDSEARTRAFFEKYLK
jgi:dienelactone hydrolase